MLVRVNALLSCTWPDIVGGRYYWTHTAYMKTTDWPNNAQLLLNWTNRVKLGYTSQVLIYGNRLIDPTDGSVIQTQTFTVPGPCDRAPFANYSLLIAGRWRFTADDGSGGYHLHRYPTNMDWVVGNEFTDAGHNSQLAAAGSMYVPGKIYSRSGSLITGWEVNREIAEWQLRHGTKRRNSRFWLP